MTSIRRLILSLNPKRNLCLTFSPSHHFTFFSLSFFPQTLSNYQLFHHSTHHHLFHHAYEVMAREIPKKQWAQVIEKTGGPIEYKEIDVATPGPDEVLVNIKYSGVCHTDLHALNGDWPLPTKLPLVGGHEGAGLVVARGELVDDDICKIGEAVGVKWLNGSCLSCDFCQQADEPLCLKPSLSGYTVDGTFQQYCIAKAAHVAHIPDGIPLDEIAPILCAGITVYKGLKESGTRPGQTIAIVGAGGGLGALCQQYAKAMGLQVIAIDSGDDKKKLCEDMGATVT